MLADGVSVRLDAMAGMLSILPAAQSYYDPACFSRLTSAVVCRRRLDMVYWTASLNETTRGDFDRYDLALIDDFAALERGRQRTGGFGGHRLHGLAHPYVALKPGVTRLAPGPGSRSTCWHTNRILSPARLPSVWYWADAGIDVDFRDFSGVYDSPNCRSHCSRIGLAWATCAEELQNLVHYMLDLHLLRFRCRSGSRSLTSE